MSWQPNGTSRVLAHRGGSQAARPNGSDGVRSAAGLGAHGVEIDVNETADRRLFATHDSFSASHARWVSDLSDADMLANGVQPLNEVLAVASENSLLVYLDVKSVSRVGLDELLRREHETINTGQIIIASSRAEILAHVHEAMPSAVTSLLYYDTRLDLSSVVDFIQPTLVHPCFDHLRDPLRTIDDGFVARARAHGLGLVSWSENDAHRLRRLVDLGFDFVCADDVAIAVTAVADADPPPTDRSDHGTPPSHVPRR